MTPLIATSHVDALDHALGLLNELRQTLDLIRAETVREELASTVQGMKAPLAALRDELEDSVAHHAGRQLTFLAEDLERTRDQPDSDDRPVLAINELHNQASVEPRLLDRTYRILHQAWDASSSPEQFMQHVEKLGLSTGFGQRVANTLAAHFETARSM